MLNRVPSSLNRTITMNTRILLSSFALSALCVFEAAAQSDPKPAEPANAGVSIWTQNVTGFRKEHGAVGGYTKKWDLSGLPHYVPKQHLTGMLRIWGTN